MEQTVQTSDSSSGWLIQEYSNNNFNTWQDSWLWTQSGQVLTSSFSVYVNDNTQQGVQLSLIYVVVMWRRELYDDSRGISWLVLASYSQWDITVLSKELGKQFCLFPFLTNILVWIIFPLMSSCFF